MHQIKNSTRTTVVGAIAAIAQYAKLLNVAPPSPISASLCLGFTTSIHLSADALGKQQSTAQGKQQMEDYFFSPYLSSFQLCMSNKNVLEKKNYSSKV